MNASIHRFLGALAIIAVALPTSADASAPAGRYVVTNGGTGNGTVYDTKTKLTWQQTVSSTTYTWADAKTYCAGVGTSLGGTGWRLPTLKELQTIVDYSQSNPIDRFDSLSLDTGNLVLVFVSGGRLVVRRVGRLLRLRLLGRRADSSFVRS
jgi:hypothetical protein